MKHLQRILLCLLVAAACNTERETPAGPEAGTPSAKGIRRDSVSPGMYFPGDLEGDVTVELPIDVDPASVTDGQRGPCPSMVIVEYYPAFVIYRNQRIDFRISGTFNIVPPSFNVGAATYTVPDGPWPATDGTQRTVEAEEADAVCYYKKIPTVSKLIVNFYKWRNVTINDPEETMNLCDDPLTEIVETECDQENSQPQSSGEVRMQETPVEGQPQSKWVCMVTDWYESTNGGPWVYVETTVDYCWIE